jgi:hypothetical protein
MAKNDAGTTAKWTFERPTEPGHFLIPNYYQWGQSHGHEVTVEGYRVVNVELSAGRRHGDAMELWAVIGGKRRPLAKMPRVPWLRIPDPPNPGKKATM